jgi:peptide-methionine (S)-S-oxide reductase
MAYATFAAGCFWGVEAAFRRVDGVRDVVVGYTGGSVEDPTYEQVCTGRTGHAEAVQVDFDPERVSFEDLLAVFWDSHDPTQLNRQGPDVGTQYRSAIYVHDDDQAERARASLARIQERLRDEVVTEITPAGPFYPAEDYHQRYLEKRGMA